MTYGSAHYWASEDLNTTGENVGITLDSMCDIIAANDVTNGNAVVFVPGDIEHGQKGHFALGEGGGGGANIDASAYQVVIGDGEGNGIGAQGGAEAQEANKIYLKNKRLGPNIPTHEDDGTPLENVDTGSFTVSSNGLGHTHTETVHDEDLDEDVEVQVEDDGWKATIEDLAKVLATGKSKVEIGEFGESYSSTFWSDTLEGPDIKIKGAAKIEMLPREDSYTPAISMRGSGIIDISDENQFDYNWYPHSNRSNQSQYLSVRSIIPFADKTKGPILQLKGSPTVAFLDQAVAKFYNGSWTEIGGNAQIHIVGGDWADNPSSSTVHTNTGNIKIKMGGSAYIDIAGGDSVASYALMNPGVMVFTTGYKASDWQYIDNSPSGFYDLFYRGEYYAPSGYRMFYAADTLLPMFHVRHATVSLNSKGYKALSSTLNSYIKGTTLSMTGPTMLMLGAQPGSATAIGVQTANGGAISVDWSTCGMFEAKIGSQGQSETVVDLVANTGSSTGMALHLSGETLFNISTNGVTSLQFNPITTFAYTFNGINTEVLKQWERYYGIFAGHDLFAQVDGNSHFESWSGTVILRSTPKTNSEEQKYYPIFTTDNKQTSVSGSIIVNSDLSGQTASELETTYETQLKNATRLPNGCPEDYVWNSFSGTSAYKQPIKYTEELTVNQVKFANLTFTNLYIRMNTYIEDVEDLKVSPEFIKAIECDVLRCDNHPTLTISEIVVREIRNYNYKNKKYEYCIDKIVMSAANISYIFTIRHDDSNYTYELPYSVNSSTAYDVVRNREPVNGGFYDYSSAYGYRNTRQEYEYTETITTKAHFNSIGEGSFYYGITVSIGTYINPSTDIETFLSNERVMADLRSKYGQSLSRVVTTANSRYAYGSKRYSYYYYTIYNVILEYDAYPISFKYYNNNDSILNQPEKTMAELSAISMKNIYPGSNQTYSYVGDYIANQYSTTGDYFSDYHGKWDYDYIETNNDYASVETQKYQVSTTSIYVGGIDTHLNVDWRGPIQTADRIGAKNWDKAPIIQSYGPANVCIREKFAEGTSYSFAIETTTDEFDLTDVNEAIREFISSTYYSDLEDYIENNYTNKELYLIKNMTQTDSTHYAVSYTIKDNYWKREIDSYTDTPVVDITEGSELRIYGGAKIKAVTKYGETTYEFSSADSNEDPVSFTLAELKALKQLLNNI